MSSGPAEGPVPAPPPGAPRRDGMPWTEIVDISTPLHPHTVAYPGDRRFERTVVSRIDDEGMGYNLTAFSMSAHSGTHLDAPFHFLPEGRRIHEFPAERWITSALVIDIGDAAAVEAAHITEAPLQRGMSVLFRTRNCHALARQQVPDPAVALTAAAAQACLDRGVQLVGIDGLSVDGTDDPSYPVHHILLGADILILEGVQLHHVEAGPWTLAVFPLHLMDADGAPARAALLR